MDTPTALSVNLNKIAVLRNSRGGDQPDPLRAAEVCIAAGADGITVHPRPDRRHIRPDDLRGLRRVCQQRVEFNIEGNPFAPPRQGYPGFLPLVLESPPQQCTLVPDGDGQLTSDHGFDPRRDIERLASVVATLKAESIRVSVSAASAMPERSAPTLIVSLPRPPKRRSASSRRRGRAATSATTPATRDASVSTR